MQNNRIAPRRSPLMPRVAVALAFASMLLASPVLAQDPDNVFAKAVAIAQERCVKIYGAGTNKAAGYATGLIVSPNGHILTAQGIYLSSPRLRVTLPDGTTHDAQIARRNRKLESALLKIETDTPDFFTLPEKPNVQKGDWVLSVSNLFKVADGAEQMSVNLGIVSLRSAVEGRHRKADLAYEGDVLLVDAITSNPGASGGALVDVEGNLVGMIGKLMMSSRSRARLNYAVPADLLADFVAGKTTDVTGDKPDPDAKPSLGIRLFAFAGKRAPAYIDRVIAGSPAAKAGLKKDDLILAISGEVIRNTRDYKNAFKKLRPGTQTTIVVKRKLEIFRVDLTPVAKK